MSFSRGLISHAIRLLSMEQVELLAESARAVFERRAVSAAYYALFHHINGAAAGLIAPNVPVEVNHRIQRWFEHTEMKTVCGRFLKSRLDQPLLDLIGHHASPDLQSVARTFIKLQQARHSADYDLSYNLTSEDAEQFVLEAVAAMASWDRIADSPEANIFVLSLLMWKNWERER